MAIDGFNFNTISSAQTDPDSPVDTIIMTGFRDNHEFVMRWLGKSFLGGAIADHNHDGVNSAKVTTADLAGDAGDVPGFDAAVQAVAGFGGSPGALSYSTDSGVSAGGVFSSTIPANAKSVQYFIVDSFNLNSHGTGFIEFGADKLFGAHDEEGSVAARDITLTATLQDLFVVTVKNLQIKKDAGSLVFDSNVSGSATTYQIKLTYTIFA